MAAAFPLRILVMGVSGAGKTTFGTALAGRLGLPYCDGDSFHPPANIAKMSRGEPLDDSDRAPWLARIGIAFRDQAPVVIGCSALQRRYRDQLRQSAGGPLTIIFLEGSRQLLLARMQHRSGHFMPPGLLDSQLSGLEPPGPDEQPIRLRVAEPPDRLLERALEALAPICGAGVRRDGA